MRRPRTLLFLVALGSAVGAALYRLRRSRSRVHVDLYFQDGSLASFPEETPEAARLLSLARDVRRA